MSLISQLRADKHRILALGLLIVAYVLIYEYFHETRGGELAPLSMVPVLFAAWWFGFRAGLGFAVLLFAINTLLIGRTLTPALADVVQVGGTGAVALILSGGVAGKMRDLSHQLKQELSERRRTEEELRRHRADLEGVVSARTAELRQAVCQLQQEITERKQTQEELRQSLEKEKRLNQLKSRFSAMVSHEFRTPLTVIQSSAELLETYSDRMSEKNKSEKFRTIHSQVEHMVALLNDILTLDRAETVGPVYSPQPVDVAVFCAEVIDEYRPTAKSHRIEYTASGSPIFAMIDETLMRRALTNLLSNAVKYSPPDSAIEVRTVREYGQVLITVKDHGIGIPEKDKDDLFQIFHRAHNVGLIEGTGLGLTITKQAVVAHGGAIDFESEINVGTTFMIALPEIAADEAGAPALQRAS